MYFPNFKLYENPEKIFFGRFISASDEDSLIMIEDHLDMIKIKVKRNNPSLLKLL